MTVKETAYNYLNYNFQGGKEVFVRNSKFSPDATHSHVPFSSFSEQLILIDHTLLPISIFVNSRFWSATLIKRASKANKGKELEQEPSLLRSRFAWLSAILTQMSDAWQQYGSKGDHREGLSQRLGPADRASHVNFPSSSSYTNLPSCLIKILNCDLYEETNGIVK